jgi:predicted nucleic acid-binding protein
VMARRFLVDTDVIIEYLRGREQALEQFLCALDPASTSQLVEVAAA